MRNNDKIEYLEKCFNLTSEANPVKKSHFEKEWENPEIAFQVNNIRAVLENILEDINPENILTPEEVLRANFPAFWNKICKPGDEVKTFIYENIIDD